MRKRPATLTAFLSRTGRFSLTARGTAIPMMKRKAGKMRSAGVSPFHCAWSRNQGGLATGPMLSTRIMPTMVSPLYTSSDCILTFGLSIVADKISDSFVTVSVAISSSVIILADGYALINNEATKILQIRYDIEDSLRKIHQNYRESFDSQIMYFFVRSENGEHLI